MIVHIVRVVASKLPHTISEVGVVANVMMNSIEAPHHGSRPRLYCHFAGGLSKFRYHHYYEIYALQETTNL